MKLFLIGMPGSGKSTLGKQLAGRLTMPFVDLDAEIERSQGLTITEIFATQGEDHFRLVESDTLRNLIAGSGSFVMATGGGAPCFFNGIEAMNASGLTIFLDVPVAELVRRLLTKKDRPLLMSESSEDLTKRLENIRDERYAIYSSASISVKNPTADTILDKIRFR